MAQASRDQNSVPTLLAVSSVDGVTPVVVYADPVTHRLLVDSAGGGGGSPGGADTDVQFNDGGNFGGDSGFTYDSAGSATLTETLFAETVGLEDTNASHYLLLASGSDLTQNRTLTFVTGDAARIITLSGNPTLADWFDQAVKAASTPTFAGAALSGGTTTLGIVAGTIDMGGATSLEIPNGAAPVVNADGEIAIDNTVADFDQGVIKYFSTAEMGVVAMPVAEFTSPSNGDIVTYNASTNSFELVPAAGGGANTALSNLAAVAINTSLISDTDVTDDLGSLAIRWRAIYAGVLSTGDTAADTLLLQGYDSDGGAGVSFMTITAGNTPTATMSGITASANLTATSNDGAALGTTALQWSDLFLASGAVINWANGDVLITHSSNLLAHTGASSGYTFDAALLPSANDAAAVGGATVAWSDLFLASGALINFANGNAVITHSSGIISVTTGELRITSANVGTNADSVPTLSSTSTLTNKTLTSPTINTATLGGAQQLNEGASIRLDTTGSADGAFSGITLAGTAGTTLAFGDLIYKDPTDSRWELADANSAAAADGDSRGTLGMCVLAAASDGDPTVILLYGIIRADTAFPSMTINNQQYVSETAGDITGTQPATTDVVIRVVGVALTADELLFNPSPDYITHT